MQTIETPDDVRVWRQSRAAVTVARGKRRLRLPVPAAETLLVARALLTANQYNPNFVSQDKMKLLRQSVLDNGFCFPVVTIWDDSEERLVIVDGFHRFIIAGPNWLDLSHVPAVILDHDISARMYATVQFNKARGVHQVDLDADVIRALIEQGQSEDEISVHLGIDLETIHRYKQLTGIAELFKNADYSTAWTAVDAIPEDAAA
jgi:ParB-like chromosome segregation protein Spo0J